MPEIRHFAVAGNGNGQLVIAAIAGPGPGDLQFSPDVWLAQEVSDDVGNPWPAAWRSLGVPADGHQLDGIAVVPNVGGGLEVAVTARNQTVWHNRQDNADADWSGWTSLGNPVADGSTIAPPALAQNQDGRLEVHLRVGGQIWHSWQKAAGGHDWVPWASLGQPVEQEPVGLPRVALDVDGLLQVFTTSGPDVWMRGQPVPGQGPWQP